jgi:hypothetical protein
MEKRVKKTATTKQVKMKTAAKAPGAIVDVPTPQPSLSVTEQGPMDVANMDRPSGLSGIPTQSGQK